MHLCNEMFLSLCKMFGTVNHDVLCLVPRLQANNLEHVMNLDSKRRFQVRSTIFIAFSFLIVPDNIYKGKQIAKEFKVFI